MAFPLKALILTVALGGSLPVTAFAQHARDESGHTSNQQWGITLWGLSYHTNRNAGYETLNWGLGVRYYRRPHWRWLGKSPNNRVFLEGDVIRNSNDGLALPVSAGTEYWTRLSPARCRLFAVGALTLAYYHYPATDRADVKFGPVPGAAVGCGPVKVNVSAVLRKSSSPLAALVASMTIVF